MCHVTLTFSLIVWPIQIYIVFTFDNFFLHDKLFFPVPGKMYNVLIIFVMTKTTVNVLQCFILCVIA